MSLVRKYGLAIIIVIGFISNIRGQSDWSATVPFPQGQSLNSVHLFNEQKMILAGHGGSINVTTDGGATWSGQVLDNGIDLYALHFVDTNNGWVAGSYGRVYKSTDGGSSWAECFTSVNHTLYSVFFANDQVGWAAGVLGLIIHTDDGGNSWISQSSSTCL